MKYKFPVILHALALLFFFSAGAFASEEENDWDPAPIVHDPVIMKQGDTYYLFSTGPGLCIWYSTDFQVWKRLGVVFETPEPWMLEAVPTFKGEFWAPDISFYNGQYYLYYAVSAFGKNTSCIGLATNTTLNPNDPDYKWVDRGKILQSIPGEDNWNAIDPQLVVDDDGIPYMAFGSFWSGLQLVQLRPDRMALSTENPEIINIASRIPQTEKQLEGYSREAGDGAIEGAYIYKHGDYYYLFAAIDYCCRGAESNYKMVVGRSAQIKGPYIDLSGRKMTEGGGTILMQGNKDWFGVGHNSVFFEDGKYYLVLHGYDAHGSGNPPRLIIEEFFWGWPIIMANNDPRSIEERWLEEASPER